MATGRIPTTANSPLTAKGDIFTFSTGSAKLAVGNDGQLLTADSTATTGLSYQNNFAAGKNKIINGDFNINQRNFTSTTTAAAYGFDRWNLQTDASAVTYSTQAFTPGTAPVTGYESKNYARLVTTSQTGVAYGMLQQKIEDVRVCANSTITVSFWAKAASGTPKIGVAIDQNFGSGGSTAVTTASTTIPTITTSWVRYSFNVSVPSISGKTIGTSSYLGINIVCSMTTSYNPPYPAVGLQNNTFDIWGVQVEDGSVATAFQTATGTIQGELAACQRYYYRIGGTALYETVGFGRCSSATNIQTFFQTPVTLRSNAASVEYSTLIGSVNASATTTVSAVTINQSSKNTVDLTVSCSGASFTTGGMGQIQTNNSLSGYLAVSAEL